MPPTLLETGFLAGYHCELACELLLNSPASHLSGRALGLETHPLCWVWRFELSPSVWYGLFTH